MSIALQWLAMAMVGFADAPEPKAAGPEITYQCQVIEVNGLHWREAVGHGLKPVTSQGGVTVWTASPEFFKTLPEGTTKDLVMSPKVTALSLAPAHMTVRNSHPFVTQVSWRGDGSGPRQTTETIREGMTWTIAGRSIDQGVLAQLVIEDTDIRSVHTVNVPAPATSSAPATTSMAKPPTGQASYLIVEDIHLVNLAEIGTLTMTADEAVIDADQPLTFKAVFDQSGDDSKSTACANRNARRQSIPRWPIRRRSRRDCLSQTRMRKRVVLVTRQMPPSVTGQRRKFAWSRRRSGACRVQPRCKFPRSAMPRSPVNG